MDEIQNPHITHIRLQLREMTCGKEKMRKRWYSKSTHDE
jgi:hypothetical protein